MKYVLFCCVFFFGFLVLASNQIYTPAVQANGTSEVQFFLPYRAGIHHGFAKELGGQVVLDDYDQLQSAHFEIPIRNLSTNNETRDCHMREALGLKYQGSRFPEEHVCNSDNRLPESGRDSIVYPFIVLDFVRFVKAPLRPLPLGADVEAQVHVRLQIHGVSREMTIPLKIKKTSLNSGHSRLEISSKFRVLLTDFDIEVKPFKLGPFEIGVGNNATVEIDIFVQN